VEVILDDEQFEAMSGYCKVVGVKPAQLMRMIAMERIQFNK